MYKKIIVTSTWDNNYKLLKFFINFYNCYWKYPSFLFICGYTNNEEKEVLNHFSNNDIFFKRKLLLLRYNDKFARNLKFYKFNKYYLVTYKTIKNKKSNDWLRLRKNLYSLVFKKRKFSRFDYYLNTDNDDYFYVKNLEEYLKNYSKNPEEHDFFHSLEFLPVESFSNNSNLQFISYPYYYIHKSRGKMTDKNSHSCRKLNLQNKYLNEIHINTEKIEVENCQNFESKYELFEEIDRACFAFGCLDLNHLKNTKHFVQATKDLDKKEVFMLQDEEIEEKFNSFYILTENEKKKYKIFDLNVLKNFF